MPISWACNKVMQDLDDVVEDVTVLGQRVARSGQRSGSPIRVSISAFGLMSDGSSTQSFPKASSK
jgi:hypothetical protein